MSRQLISSGAKWETEVGYSRAVRAGSQIFISGTTAVAGRSRVVGEGDIRAQAKHIFGIIEESLHKAGACLEDVVRTRMFGTDIAMPRRLAKCTVRWSEESARLLHWSR